MAPFRFLVESDVQQLLPTSEFPALVDLMEETLAAFSSGQAVQPLRSAVTVGPPGQYLGVMPGLLPSSGALGTKLVNVIPHNPARGLSAHLGVIVLFDPDTGHLRAIMDARYVTEIRTAAVSAVSVRHLARRDACCLGVIGTGVQARSHVEALASLRPLRGVKAWSPDAAQLEQFTHDMSGHTGVRVVAAASAEEAVRDADLLVLATASMRPVIDADWVSPGTHVISVGACRPNQREMDSRLLPRARVIVDSREAALVESGDLVMGIQEGSFAAGDIAGELGQVVAGDVPGRESEAQVTVFKSLGLAVEDVATASLVWQRACRLDVGLELEM